MMLVFFYILTGIQTGASEEVYLKRTAASWSTELQHQDAKTRRAAVFAIGKLGKSALPYVGTLKSLLQQDQEVSVRSACATSLGELGALAVNEIAPSLLLAFEKEKQISVRRTVALALGKLGDQAASGEPLLRKALSDSDAALRQNAAWSLGQLGKAAEPAISALMVTLNDPDAGVRAEAAQALGNLGSLAEESIPSLQGVLTDRDARVQEQAIIALRRMGPLAASSIASLLSIAETTKGEATIRQAALITIESIWPTGLKEPASWNRLQSLAQSEKDALVKAAAQQAVKKIGPLRK